MYYTRATRYCEKNVDILRDTRETAPRITLSVILAELPSVAEGVARFDKRTLGMTDRAAGRSVSVALRILPIGKNGTRDRRMPSKQRRYKFVEVYM